MTDLPRPAEGDRPVATVIRELDALVGRDRFVAVCVDLLGGADRTSYVPELRYLTGHSWEDGDPVRDPAVWRDYWVRTWGARGLLYVWDDSAAPAVVAGLDDEHWRPGEMCLKVSTKREIGEAGPGAARLAVEGELPRVRVQALRTLGAVGDTEHVGVVRGRLDDDDPAVRRQAGRSLEQLARRLDLPGLPD